MKHEILILAVAALLLAGFAEAHVGNSVVKSVSIK